MLRVSAIIPHAGGWDILLKCLTSLYRSRDVEFEAIIVENGSFERIEEEQVRRFPGLRILRFERRLGFAGACNRGAEAAAGKHLFLLNNDAEVEPDTIYILSEALESDNKLAACQPKILSLRNPGRFDYSSACGGEIDVYGFPFARGRLFETIEDDVGQYDDCSEIFWGAGAALMIRRDIFLGSGGPLPCDGGILTDGGNRLLFDSTGDGSVNITDAIHLLNFLFLAGPPPAEGTRCVRMAGCPDACR